MPKRVYNFSPGPAVSPCPSWKPPSATCWPCRGPASPSWKSAIAPSSSTDHRAGRGQSSQAAGHSRQLPRPVPARRGPVAVRHDPHELAAQHAASRPITSSPAPGRKRPPTRPRRKATVQVGLGRQAEQLQPRAPAGRAEAGPQRRLCLPDLERDHPGRAIPSEPECGDVPLVCDASSDFLSRPVPIDRYGLIYACARRTPGRRA